jgi:hypothetical protein
MDKKTINWVKSTLTNAEDASDAELRAYFIENGLTEAEADRWIAKRRFYQFNMVIHDDDYNDIGIFDPNTRTIKPLDFTPDDPPPLILVTTELENRN